MNIALYPTLSVLILVLANFSTYSSNLFLSNGMVMLLSTFTDALTTAGLFGSPLMLFYPVWLLYVIFTVPGSTASYSALSTALTMALNSSNSFESMLTPLYS